MKNIFFSIALFTSIAHKAQTVFTVDNNQGSGAAYTSVQAAINDASPDDIIYIQPSPNTYGNIQMTKRLSIFGIGHNPEINSGLQATIGSILFNAADASASKISGLNIAQILLDNQTYNNHDVIITNNKIGYVLGNALTTRSNNVILSGNYFRNPNFRTIDTNNSQNWIISNNIIEQPNSNSTWSSFSRFNGSTIFKNNIFMTRQNGNSEQSIQVFNNCIGAQISNNIFLFRGNAVTNMDLAANSGLNFQHNLTFSYNTTLNPLSGTNNIDNTDPQFVSFNQNVELDSTSNDFNIQSGSLAENAGTDGNDLGVFNGNFPFNLRGYPTELPYLVDFVIYNTTIIAGEPININIRANANIND